MHDTVKFISFLYDYNYSFREISEHECDITEDDFFQQASKVTEEEGMELGSVSHSKYSEQQ